MVDLAKLRKQAKKGQKAKAEPAKPGADATAKKTKKTAKKKSTKKSKKEKAEAAAPEPAPAPVAEVAPPPEPAAEEAPSPVPEPPATEASATKAPAPAAPEKETPEEAGSDSQGEGEEGVQEGADALPLVEYLVFHLGEELYGISIDDIVEIVPYRPSTPVPKTPHFVEGIISLRGKIILVMDVRQRLGLPKYVHEGEVDDRRIIIFEMQDENMSIVVDHISQVVRVDREEVQQVGDLFADLDASFASGALEHNQRLVALLDINGLFSWGQE